MDENEKPIEDTGETQVGSNSDGEPSSNGEKRIAKVVLGVFKKIPRRIAGFFKYIVSDKITLILLPVFLTIMVVTSVFIIKDFQGKRATRKTNDDTGKVIGSLFDRTPGTSSTDQPTVIPPAPVIPTDAPDGTQEPGADYSTEQAKPTTIIPTASPKPVPPKDLASLEAIEDLRIKYGNNDVVGMFSLPGLISMPVMQRRGDTTNTYYLRRDEYGKDRYSGSIFMDFENNPLRDDKNVVLYGHNMKDETMFHHLRFYVSLGKEFYDQNKYMCLVSEYGVGVYEVFSWYTTHTSFQYTTVYFKNDEFGDLIKEIQKRAQYNTGALVTKDDRILTLSTCTNMSDDTRIVVHAKFIGYFNDITDENIIDSIISKVKIDI